MESFLPEASVYALVRRGQEYVLHEAVIGAEDGADMLLVNEEPAMFVGSRDEILLALQAAANDVLWQFATVEENGGETNE